MTKKELKKLNDHLQRQEDIRKRMQEYEEGLRAEMSLRESKRQEGYEGKYYEALEKMAKISADAAFVALKALEIAKTELLSIPTAEIEEGCLCETEEEAE